MKKSFLLLLIACCSLASMAQQKEGSAKELIKKGEAAEEMFRDKVKKSELEKAPVILNENAAKSPNNKAATKRKSCKKTCKKKDS